MSSVRCPARLLYEKANLFRLVSPRRADMVLASEMRLLLPSISSSDVAKLRLDGRRPVTSFSLNRSVLRNGMLAKRSFGMCPRRLFDEMSRCTRCER